MTQYIRAFHGAPLKALPDILNAKAVVSNFLAEDAINATGLLEPEELDLIVKRKADPGLIQEFYRKRTGRELPRTNADTKGDLVRERFRRLWIYMEATRKGIARLTQLSRKLGKRGWLIADPAKGMEPEYDEDKELTRKHHAFLHQELEPSTTYGTDKDFEGNVVFEFNVPRNLVRVRPKTKFILARPLIGLHHLERIHTQKANIARVRELLKDTPYKHVRVVELR